MSGPGRADTMRGVTNRLSHLRSEHGQTSAEYLGMILVVAAIIGAIVATGIGSTISDRIEEAICKIAGGDCGPQLARERCKTRSTTSTDKLTVGLDVRLFSGEGGGERVIIKEEFDDGTARYIVTDKASLAAALGGKGGSAGLGGVGGSLTAALAAEGVLQDARVFETANAEQTQQIEDALKESGGLEGALRGLENALDVPVDLITENLPFGADFTLSDHIDIDGFLFDQVFGDEDLPEPNSESIGGEIALVGTAGARDDRGPEEIEASGELRAAAGGLLFTSGPREGEREYYYKISGRAGVELKSEMLGAGNAAVNGSMTVTLVIGADGLPKALRVNGTGTAAGLNDLGDPSVGLSEADLREFAIDRDLSAGKTVEFTAELDLRNRDLSDAVFDILRAGPDADLPAAGLDLARILGDQAKIEYGIYDTSKREDTTNSGIVVASLKTEDTEQVNTLDALYRKPPGGTFQRIDCNA